MSAMAMGPPDWVKEPLSWVGMQWPDADPIRLKMMSDEWLNYSQQIWFQLFNGDGAVEKAVQENAGRAIEAFDDWWRHTSGPQENLRKTVESAENIGAALKALATQAVILQAIFVAELIALAAAVAVIIKAVAIGGVLAAAGATARQAAVKKTKSGLGGAVALAVGLVVVGGGIAALLRKSRLEPVPEIEIYVDPRTIPGPKPSPSPLGPDLVPPWQTITQDWEDNRRPRCFIRPEWVQQGNPPYYSGRNWSTNDPDREVYGGGIFHIGKDLGRNGEDIVRIDGIVRDALDRKYVAPNYQRKLAGLDVNIGIPTGLYHLAHLWGPGFGDEAMAGITLGPQDVNLGEQSRAEEWIRQLHDHAKTIGTTPGSPYVRAWVEATAQMHTFPSTHVRNLEGENIGGNLLQSVDYTATLCAERRDGEVHQETHKFGFKVDPPVFDAANWTVAAGGIYGMYATAPPRLIQEPRR